MSDDSRERERAERLLEISLEWELGEVRPSSDLTQQLRSRLEGASPTDEERNMNLHQLSPRRNQVLRGHFSRLFQLRSFRFAAANFAGVLAVAAAVWFAISDDGPAPDTAGRAAPASVGDFPWREIRTPLELEELPDGITALRASGSQIDLAVLMRIKARFPELVAVDFVDTNLTDGDLARLSSLPRLRYLGLPECRLVTAEGIAHLASLKELESLDLRGWVGQTMGEIVDSPYSKITDDAIPGIAALPRLRSLNLFGTGVKDVGIARLCRDRNPRLVKLDLGMTGVTVKGVRELARLPNLSRLKLTGNAMLGDPAARALAKLPALRSLDFGGNGFSSSRLTDRGLESLIGISGLRELRISQGKKLTSAGLDRLSTMKGLEALGLESCTGFTGVQLGRLTRLENLRRLDLNYDNEITDDDLATVRFSALDVLDLKGAGRKIGEPGMRGFADNHPNTRIIEPSGRDFQRCVVRFVVIEQGRGSEAVGDATLIAIDEATDRVTAIGVGRNISAEEAGKMANLDASARAAIPLSGSVSVYDLAAGGDRRVEIFVEGLRHHRATISHDLPNRLDQAAILGGTRKNRFPSQGFNTGTEVLELAVRIRGTDGRLRHDAAVMLTSIDDETVKLSGLRRSWDAERQVEAMGNERSVPKGRYRLLVFATGAKPHEEIVDLEPGKTRRVSIALN